VLAAVSLTVFLAGGCANRETVKSEEQIVPATSSKALEPTSAVATGTAPVVAKVEPASSAQTTQAVPTINTDSVPAAVEPVKESKISPAAAASVQETSFETVYFDFDKSDIRQDGRDVLKKNADVIQKGKAGIKVQIAGNCDERGSAEYNLALGERRAKAAQQYLTTLGVAADRLSIISYGKEKPAVDGHDEAAWAKNRRDDFVIVP